MSVHGTTANSDFSGPTDLKCGKPNWTLEGLECGIGGVGGSLEAQLGHWDLEGGSLEPR